jgi:ABC-type sugar transport system substrate-binding protein
MQVSAVSRVHSSRPVNTGSSTFLPSTKEGRVEALVGQRPFEMGYKAPTVMIDLIEGKKVDDPVFTGLDECTRETADTCIQK